MKYVLLYPALIFSVPPSIVKVRWDYCLMDATFRTTSSTLLENTRNQTKNLVLAKIFNTNGEMRNSYKMKKLEAL